MELNEFGSTTCLLRSYDKSGAHNEGFSSGYDSNSEIDIQINTTKSPDDSLRWAWRGISDDDDSDSEISDTDSCISESESEDESCGRKGAGFTKEAWSEDESSDSEDEDSMKFVNTETVREAMNHVITMPDLCDVIFLVGPSLTPIHGLKSIMSTRSRIFYQLIFKATKEAAGVASKKKKSKKIKPVENQKPVVNIPDVSVGIFKRLVAYIHTGSVDIKPQEVTELTCAAHRFDLPDLVELCIDFLETCTTTTSIYTVLDTAKRIQGHSIALKIVAKMTERLNKLETKKTLRLKKDVFQ
ncbi:serine-enriched protein-like [Saccostrea echinata]|uniref:serine-enriched protein-like n=1 Tax=Saccostrea echinata TaxID=191078 RepID=UPI002A837541|nr:serine-enriched protein-like [Saccostrea echinata]